VRPRLGSGCDRVLWFAWAFKPWSLCNGGVSKIPPHTPPVDIAVARDRGGSQASGARGAGGVAEECGLAHHQVGGRPWGFGPARHIPCSWSLCVPPNLGKYVGETKSEEEFSPALREWWHFCAS